MTSSTQQTDVKRRLALGLVTTNVLSSIFAFSLVPGFEDLFIIPLAELLLLLYFSRGPNTRKIVLATSSFALLLGYLVRTLSYAEFGFTPLVVYATILIGAISIASSFYVYNHDIRSTK